MAEPNLTHAQLTAKLIVEGVLPMLEGKGTPGSVGIDPIPLNAEERKRLDAPDGALLVLYPLGDTGVFFMMHGSNARAWYHGIDTDGALETLESLLTAKYPKATIDLQLDHETPGMRVRAYQVAIDAKHFAVVEATYPYTRDVQQQFVVRVHAQERR